MLSKSQKRKFTIIFWSLFLAVIVLLVVLFTLINQGKMGFMPTFEQLENPKSAVASEVVSADQELLGKYYRKNRTVVDFEDLSPNLINALIATEDARFYSHSGIDWIALSRAVFGVLTGTDQGGGSTITQQLAKNLFKRRDIDTDTRLGWYREMALIKFKEWITAVKLERNYTKEEIIAMYLNTVSFGSQAFGIKSAAHTFFNKPPDSLKIEEAALLVGLLKAPSRYSPVISEETRKRSRTRRNVVISQLEEYDYISRSTRDSLQNSPIELEYNVRSHSRGLATYFREFLRSTLTATKPRLEDYPSWRYQQFQDDSAKWETNPLYGWCNKNQKSNGENYDLYKDGLKIYTTINSKMQQYAENAVEEHLKKDLQPAFNKTKRGNPKWPFSRNLTQKQIGEIIRNSVRRSERYRVLRNQGLSMDSIMENFRKPIQMNDIFTWEGEVDTVMSPMDSIYHYKKYLQAGMMSMEPQTGYVRAYVGGINYEHYQFDNVTLSRRQVGSTFKPFLYTLAMMPGEHDPCDKVPNVEVSFKTMEDGEEKIYTPRYSPNDKENEMVTLKYGLAKSLNQISSYLMKQYGPRNVIKIAKKMGVASHLEPVYSLAVGAAEVKLEEMVAAYSTFADKGIYTNPVYVTRIEDKLGNVLAQFRGRKREVMDPRTAYKMLSLMKGVVNFGTSVRLRLTYKFNNEIAGKTGTTNNNSDGWFIGIVPELITGVWVGGEVRSIHFNRTKLGQGANMALPIWALYMKDVYDDPSLSISKRDSFKRPQNLNIRLDCGNEDAEDAKNREGEELFSPKEDLF